MMLGALGAVLFDRSNKYYITIFANKMGQIIVWAVFLLSGIWGDYVPAIIREEVIAVMSLFLITGQVCNSSFINLENKACDYVGKISYGIYVIHPLLIFLSSYAYRMLNIDLPIWLQSSIIYIYTIVATIIVANLSYNYVEKPFLKLKNKFAIVRSQTSLKK
jgi:peptidoglycan/LPS O-acetylase OafA/YrhL